MPAYRNRGTGDVVDVDHPKDLPSGVWFKLHDGDLRRALRVLLKTDDDATDRIGEDAILHPLRVAMSCSKDDERIVALLHDVVEDDVVSLEYLRGEFTMALVEAVDAITRRDGEQYFDYIERVAKNPLARAVKLKDLQDNLQRQHPSPEEKESLKKRYLKALVMLEAELDFADLQVVKDART